MQKIHLALLTVVALSACQTINNIQSAPAASNASSSSIADATTVKEYRNDKHNFGFRYPSGWTLTEDSFGDRLLILERPLTQAESSSLAEAEKNDMGSGPLYASEGFSLTYCKDINARCGPMYGNSKTYKDLEDFLSDTGTLLSVTSHTTIGEAKAYAVTTEAQENIIMFEHNGIYIMSFGSGQSFTSTVQGVIDSFVFSS